MKETPPDRTDRFDRLDRLERSDDDLAMSEDELAVLLREAGPGDRVPDDELAPIRAKAREAWRGQVRRTSAQRGATRAILAIAAAVALTIAIALIRRPPAEPAGADAIVATVETVTGGATLGSGGAANGAEVAGGATITTADTGRAALRLASGPSVRIDVQSSVRVVSDRSLRLDRGALYIDTRAETRVADANETAPGTARNAVVIETPFGTVTDLGTRFEVRLLGEATETAGSQAGASPRGLEIKVRDGAVRLVTATSTYDAPAGSVLVVEGDGAPKRGERASYDDAWSWVESVRPPVAIEGITCVSFLDWAARESGRTWRFADPASGRDAGAAVVHGSIEGLTVDEALSTVLPSCGLRHRVDGGVLVIESDGG